jgi:hypothetical protein
MSQFLLVSSLELPRLEGVILENLSTKDRLLANAAEELFSRDNQTFQILNIDALTLIAQQELLDGKKLEQTAFGTLLLQLARSGIEFALFYGNDWKEVSLADKPKHLFHLVHEALLDPGREIYVHFVNKPRHKSNNLRSKEGSIDD